MPLPMGWYRLIAWMLAITLLVFLVSREWGINGARTTEDIHVAWH